MVSHDPIQFASGLSAKLATRSRHVCVFLGAGMSRACGLPDVVQLQERVVKALEKTDAAVLSEQLKAGNLEHVLTRLRRIAALLTGDQQVDGLTAASAVAVDTAICAAIVGELDLDAADLGPAVRLAAWVARADYHLPVELFTVNYDLLLETALEQLRVPYFDGFIGTLRARFQTELVEGISRGRSDLVPAFFARLWKLHGSVNWAWEEGKQIVRLGHPVPDGDMAAIYPSDTKYEESRRVPFVVLQDRFRRALHQPETLVLISGYSFSDDHLNELLFDAATRRERSELVAFCFSDPPQVLAERAKTTPNLQVVSPKGAILGGIEAAWKAPDEAPPNLWENDEFALCNFAHLAAYLARSATREPERDELIAALLEKVAPDVAGGGPAEAVTDG